MQSSAGTFTSCSEASACIACRGIRTKQCALKPQYGMNDYCRNVMFVLFAVCGLPRPAVRLLHAGLCGRSLILCLLGEVWNVRLSSAVLQSGLRGFTPPSAASARRASWWRPTACCGRRKRKDVPRRPTTSSPAWMATCAAAPVTAPSSTRAR